MTSGWFATRRLEPGVHLVSEPVHVNSFLVEGSATAALIDTGLGIGNIREAAESLVSRECLPSIPTTTSTTRAETTGSPGA